MPASPPRFGAQARIHGLMSELARRHNVTALMLVDSQFDVEECRRAMQVYCREVHLLANPLGVEGPSKRLLQMRSLLSPTSFERLRVMVPGMQAALDGILQSRRFDLVNLEFAFLGHLQLRQAPPGAPLPAVVVDSHNIDYDLARQYAKSGSSLSRRLYAAANWKKLRREELGTYRDADGVYLCSANDERRLKDDVPAIRRTTVIPNAANTEFYQPRLGDPAPDGKTIVFFGLMSYVPNIDGVTWFVSEIWPRIIAARPDVRLKIVGGHPPDAIKSLASEQIEVTGFVDDLRPHLASAALIVVPLRLGGGTRLKIVEAMAMGKAIVSTSLGAEGIEAANGRDIVIADEPQSFAGAVTDLLADPGRTAEIADAARRLAVERYAWSTAAMALEAFYRKVLDETRLAVPA